MKKTRVPIVRLLLALMLVVLLLPRISDAAEKAYAFLEADGTALNGDSTVQEIGGHTVSDAIECFSVVYEYYAEGSDVRAAAIRYTPLTLRKRVDKSSPLLAQALVDGHTITGHIWFFDRDPDSGAERKFYTLTLTGARITAIRSWLPDTQDASHAFLPKLEEISIVYDTLTLEENIAPASFVLGPGTATRKQ